MLWCVYRDHTRKKKKDSKFLTDSRTERHKENGLVASPQRLIHPLTF